WPPFCIKASPGWRSGCGADHGAVSIVIAIVRIYNLRTTGQKRRPVFPQAAAAKGFLICFLYQTFFFIKCNPVTDDTAVSLPLQAMFIVLAFTGFCQRHIVLVDQKNY